MRRPTVPPPDRNGCTISSAPRGRGGAKQSPRAAARAQEWLAAGLAMIAGYVDGYGIITYGTYLSFMSGNTTMTGYKIGEGQLAAAAALSAVAIACFVAGSFTGTLLGQALARRMRRLVFGAVAAALALVVVLATAGFVDAGAHIAVVSFAMGAMNTALTYVGAEAVSVTFVTGTLSRLGAHLALVVKRAPVANRQGPWDSHARRALLLVGIWAGFVGGAMLAGAATPRLGAWVLLLPIVALSILAAIGPTERGAP